MSEKRCKCGGRLLLTDIKDDMDTNDSFKVKTYIGFKCIDCGTQYSMVRYKE